MLGRIKIRKKIRRGRRIRHRLKEIQLRIPH
jgi:hypothetical protein